MGYGRRDGAEASPRDSRDSSQALKAMALTYSRFTVLILLTDAHEDLPLLAVGGCDAIFAT